MTLCLRGTIFRALKKGYDMTNFNAPAELYPGRNLKLGRGSRYRRFPSLAEAVQFTMEELPLPQQSHSILEANELRYDGQAIRELYFSADYPLRRAYVGNNRSVT